MISSSFFIVRLGALRRGYSCLLQLYARFLRTRVGRTAQVRAIYLLTSKRILHLVHMPYGQPSELRHVARAACPVDFTCSERRASSRSTAGSTPCYRALVVGGAVPPSSWAALTLAGTRWDHTQSRREAGREREGTNTKTTATAEPTSDP